MQRRLNSLSGLKAAIQNNSIAEGLSLSNGNKHSEAVLCFDAFKDFSRFSEKEKLSIKTSYYSCGKIALNAEKSQEAARYFKRALDADLNDALLLERTELTPTCFKYNSLENIAEFRRSFSLGITPGRFGDFKHPYYEVAYESKIIQEPISQIRLQSLDAVKTIGVYRTMAQGRHLLSAKIREYKKGQPGLANPFAWLLADLLLESTEFVKFVDLIVPSPSNPNKHISRGFIPSLLIGKELCKCLAIPYRELFFVKPMDCRFRDLPYNQAKELVKYREGKSLKKLFGNRILLLDDVLTSGTTMNLLADILKSSGAIAVYGLALAKTGPAKQGV